MTEFTSMTDNINTLKTRFSQLKMLGHNIEENERVELLLQSLPDSHYQPDEQQSSGQSGFRRCCSLLIK